MTQFSLSADSIQEKLNLIENAAEQAMNECPKTTDTEIDIYQQNVVDYVANTIDEERHRTLDKLNDLDTARKNIVNDIEGFSLGQIVEAARHKILRLNAELHEVLENAKQEEGAILRTYRYFRFKNKLNRDASYPESAILHWAFVMLAVLFESVINGFFFANTSDAGILGGVFQALFISLVNIGSALLMGIYVVPYKNHVKVKKQSRAKAFTAVYIIFIFFFNLMAAHEFVQ